MSEQTATQAAPVAETPKQVQHTHAIIPVGLAQSLLQWLGRQPHDAVVELLDALKQNMQLVTPTKPEPKVPEILNNPS